jgi:hypothetical protein
MTLLCYLFLLSDAACRKRAARDSLRRKFEIQYRFGINLAICDCGTCLGGFVTVVAEGNGC